ncbi:hypothetical protein CSA37_05355 [Candidatus Fermentibacteria bacterium]|nr:MAG: hypothetical protein CSA37_05355 [Candidatus Fermentibacteria bacterium]
MAKDYYKGFAECYHRHFEVNSRGDIRFYTELARQAGGKVLEIGCGTGRTLIPSARAGASVTGMDISENMLSYCRKLLSEEAQEVQKRVELISGNMADFSMKDRYRLITTPFRPFQHLATVEEQLSALKCIREHLEDKGTFILDIFDPDMEILTDYDRAEEFGEEPPFLLSDGTEVTVSYRTPSVDTVNQIAHCEMIFSKVFPDGTRRRDVQEFIMRYTFRWEAEHLLHRGGFRVVKVMGGYEGEPAGAGDLVFFCEKLHST